jgi:N-acyl-D-aspartate/D-glutamate deacylase
MRDGESFAVTADYSLQRVTVSIEDGVIAAIAVG